MPEMFWCSGLSRYCASLNSGLWFQVYQFYMSTPLEKLLDLVRKHTETPHFTSTYTVFSINKQQNCIYPCLLYFSSHDSFIHIHCCRYPWIQKQVYIRQYLTKLSRASALNSKCSACWVATPKYQQFSPQQKTLIKLSCFKSFNWEREAWATKHVDLNFTEVAFGV